MSSPRCEFVFIEPNTVMIRVAGDIETRNARQLCDDALRFFGDIAPRSVRVRIDMTRVTSCSALARSDLLRMHQIIRARANRIAYVADRPLIRGVSRWITHMADDQDAHAFGTQKQADQWLAASVKRMDQIHDELLSSMDALVGV